jgi:hypothetical protein
MDPRLIERFALFREPGPGPGGPLDEDEQEVVTLRRDIWESASQGQPERIVSKLAAKGLIAAEVRKVVLDSERVMLVIPGSAGMLVLVRTAKDHTTAGATAPVAGSMQGHPVLSSGPTLVGLAPDGVDRQPVEFRDGSVGYAPVRHNAYLIDDPSRAPE